MSRPGYLNDYDGSGFGQLPPPKKEGVHQGKGAAKGVGKHGGKHAHSKADKAKARDKAVEEVKAAEAAVAKTLPKGPTGPLTPTPELVNLFRLIDQHASKKSVQRALTKALAKEKASVQSAGANKTFSKEFGKALQAKVDAYMRSNTAAMDGYDLGQAAQAASTPSKNFYYMGLVALIIALLMMRGH
jgi:hypothetical protein